MSLSLWVLAAGLVMTALWLVIWGLTAILDQMDLYSPTGNYHRRMKRLLLLTLILWILIYFTAVVLEPPLGDPERPYERLFAWAAGAAGAAGA